ncbi:MAG: hypothetical protein JSS04_22055 [Proteobacteria bacterium]|nr:hypothetical protein [Pseudomonadota bacterium]
MRALVTAAIYFGTFLVIGYLAKRLLDRFMAQNGTDLREVQSQNKGGGQQQRFLLGGWYKDRSPGN